MITNGMGASMAINDLITQFGGKTANQLDMFGDSAVEDAYEGLTLLEYDSRVKCIVVNVFCGIFEIIPFVNALIDSRKRGIQKKPIVLRLKGNLEGEARKLLVDYQKQEIEKQGKSTIYICEEMDDAAMLAVKLSVEAQLQQIEEAHAKIHQ